MRAHTHNTCEQRPMEEGTRTIWLSATLSSTMLDNDPRSPGRYLSLLCETLSLCRLRNTVMLPGTASSWLCDRLRYLRSTHRPISTGCVWVTVRTCGLSVERTTAIHLGTDAHHSCSAKPGCAGEGSKGYERAHANAQREIEARLILALIISSSPGMSPLGTSFLCNSDSPHHTRLVRALLERSSCTSAVSRPIQGGTLAILLLLQTHSRSRREERGLGMSRRRCIFIRYDKGWVHTAREGAKSY